MRWIHVAGGSLGRRFRILRLAFPLAVLCAACASNEPPRELELAREQVREASRDAAITSNAGRELQEARSVLERAEHAWEHAEDDREDRTEHLATLAAQRVEIARETARKKLAEQEMRRLAERHREILLEAGSLDAQAPPVSSGPGVPHGDTVPR